MPPDDGLRFHDDQHVRPSGPQMPEGGPEEAVEASQRRPRPLACEHRDLPSEREDLQGGIAATADEHADCCQDSKQEFEHDSPLLHHMVLLESADRSRP
jgi:hypothetical protein